MIIEDLKFLAKDIQLFAHDPKNARTHNKKNLEAIKSSLTNFGQRKPVVCQKKKDGTFIVRAGNGTLDAAKDLGWKEIAAVILDEDDTKASGFAIADNRSAELAGWDDDILKDVLGDLKSQEVSLEGLGFEEVDLKKLGLIDERKIFSEGGEDDTPEVKEENVRVKPGDIWLLGAYFECESCGNKYDYEDGKDMKECPCG